MRLLSVLCLLFTTWLFLTGCNPAAPPCKRHSDCNDTKLRCAVGRCVPADSSTGETSAEPADGAEPASPDAADASDASSPEPSPEPDSQQKCTPNDLRDCYVGPASQAGRGRCFKGSQLCDSKGHWGVCKGQGSPEKETCNGLDDDCDGKVDNGQARCVSTVAGTNDQGYVDGVLLDARFNSPSAVALDKAGNVYVTDTLNHAIRKITPDGKVTTLAGNGKEGYKDGKGKDAMFARPGAIAIGPDNVLYVADTMNHRIRKVTLDGTVTTFAGSFPGLRNARGEDARLYSPSGIAIDAKGVIYVGDTLNHVIRKITPDGMVTTLSGTSSPSMKDGDAKTAAFNMPLGVALNLDGTRLYVTDSANHRIARVETTTGAVVTLAGGNPRGYRDGPGNQARFYLPLALTVDAKEQVYVADLSNNVIRLITPDGTVSTFVGNGVRGFKDGLGKEAQFFSPSGLAIAPRGELILADFFNHRIRRVVLP